MSITVDQGVTIIQKVTDHLKTNPDKVQAARKRMSDDSEEMKAEFAQRVRFL